MFSIHECCVRRWAELQATYPTRPQLLMLRALLLATALALILMLSACGTAPRISSAPVLPPAAMTAPCEAPPDLTSGAASAVLSNHVTTLRLYTRCATRHRDLSRWIESQDTSRTGTSKTE